MVWGYLLTATRRDGLAGAPEAEDIRTKLWEARFVGLCWASLDQKVFKKYFPERFQAFRNDSKGFSGRFQMIPNLNSQRFQMIPMISNGIQPLFLKIIFNRQDAKEQKPEI